MSELAHHLAVAVAMRRTSTTLDPDVLGAVHRIAGVRGARGAAGGPQALSVGGHVFVQPVNVAATLALLDLVARDPRLVAVVWLDLPARVEFAISQALKRVRRSSLGFMLGPAAPSRVSASISALLALHMSILRARTPAQWAAVGAHARHGTLSGAAEELACSRQAVGQALKRSNVAITSLTRPALLAILDLAAAEALPAAVALPVAVETVTSVFAAG